jgi:hypothetical protein
MKASHPVRGTVDEQNIPPKSSKRRKRPNSVALKSRIALSLAILISVTYASLVLVVNSIHLPIGKGGMFLSGISARSIAFGVLLLASAAAIKLADHYDRRDNVSKYRAAISLCLRGSLALLIFGATWGLVAGIASLIGVHLIGGETDFASNNVWYSPEFSMRYGWLVKPFIKHTLYICLICALVAVVGVILNKAKSRGLQRVATIFVGVAVLGWATLGVAHAADDLFNGELTISGRSWEHTIDAEDDPLKFNAVLLSQFSFCTLIALLATIVIASALVRTPPPRPSRRRSAKKKSATASMSPPGEDRVNPRKASKANP